MKPTTALLLLSATLLTACGTAPKNVQVLEVCPKPPILELDVPERDWQGQMQSFLRGTLPMQPDYTLRLPPAQPPLGRSAAP